MRVVLEDVPGGAAEPIAGIAFERYPRSGVGFATYLVVAPAHRRRGLGERLLDGAVAELVARGAPCVLAEVADPASARPSPLAQFRRWGARVIDARYIQPALGPGLARDRGLVLIALGKHLPPALPGATIRLFLEELYAATEGGPPDPTSRSPTARGSLDGARVVEPG